MFEFGIPSGWIIDVWNCHGVLKPLSEAGYGRLFELPEGMEWLDIGWFTVPILSSEKQYYTEKLKRKIHGWLESILSRRGGAINFSGIYPIYIDEVEELRTILIKYSPPKMAEVSLTHLF
ncbi:MAG: hypothetical protein ACPLZY_04620 [Candidatus Norongarragalinales archaeon]